MIYDLAIVGAGAAGIAAARAARERGRSAVVLEAKARIGGRAWTDRHALAFPFDRGAQWLHVYDEHPLRPLADAIGVATRVGDLDYRTHLGDRLASREEEEAREAFFESCYATAAAWARAGCDAPVRGIFPSGPWTQSYLQWLADDDGCDPADEGAIDFANYVETHREGVVPVGAGTLLERLAEGLAIERGCPVRAVDWSADPLRLETGRGAVRARRVIVTLPTDVLAGGAVRFTPALPLETERAFHDLPLGNRDKVALVLDEDVLGLPPESFVHALSPSGGAGMGFETLPRDVTGPGPALALMGHLGSDLADGLEREGERAMIDFALESLVRIAGSRARARLSGAAATAWRLDPEIRGAYSHARPYRSGARLDLARPLAGGRLRFAGEGCSLLGYGTLHGAWRSGTEAAESALASFDSARFARCAQDERVEP